MNIFWITLSFLDVSSRVPQCKICAKQIANCNICDNEGMTCLDCKKGFYIDENGFCTSDSCWWRDSTGKCIECNEDGEMILKT